MAHYEVLMLSERRNGEFRITTVHGDKAGIEITDKSEQSDMDVKDIPIGMVHVKIPRQNLYNNIISDARFFILGKQQVADDGTRTGDDLEAAATQLEYDAFAAWVDAQLPNMSVNRRNKIKAIFKLNDKKNRIITRLNRKLRSLERVDADDVDDATLQKLEEVVKGAQAANSAREEVEKLMR